MTQTAAFILAIFIYGIFPILALFGAYKGYKRFVQPKQLAYTAVPKLWHVREDELEYEIRSKLKQVKEKGETLRMLYGDTNKDGKINEEDMMTESYVMINKILNNHIPQALRDYQDLQKLGKKRTTSVKIQNADVTGEEALMSIIVTIDEQFDGLLDASYQQDAQKLLVTNRYLKQRFDNCNS